MYLHVTVTLCILFIALKKAISEFDEKKASGSATDKTLFSLGWTIDELSRLNTKGRDVYVSIVAAKQAIQDDKKSARDLSRAVCHIQQVLMGFVKGLTRHKRSAATHMLMISPSDRNRKPYALPICCLPYAGLTETQARAHISTVIREMVSRKMTVAGKY